MSQPWTIAFSEPLGEGGFWVAHCLSDPDTGECWSIIERLQPGPGVPVFQCLEPGCPPFCDHAKTVALLWTMREEETETCAPHCVQSARAPEPASASAIPPELTCDAKTTTTGPKPSRRSPKGTAPPKQLCIATIPTTREKLAHQCRNKAVWGEHCRIHARQEAVTSWDEYPTALENQSDPFEW